MKKVKKKKVKKMVWIFVLGAVVFLCLVGATGYYFQWMKKEIHMIQEHYNHFVMSQEGTKLYRLIDHQYQEVGFFSSSASLELESVFIERANQKYFKIANTDYYVYYSQVSKVEQRDVLEIPSYVATYWKQIPSGTYVFYQNDQEIFSMTVPNELDILYEDDTYVYVSFFGNLYGILKENVTITEKESEEEGTDFVPVFEIARNNESCAYSSCIRLSKVEELLSKLQERGAYTVSDADYLLWTKGFMKLKPGAILLHFNTESESLREIVQKYGFTLVESDFAYVTNQQASNVGTDITQISQYSLNHHTSIEQLEKMLKGEEVVVEVPKSVSTTNAKELPGENEVATQIAGLNYHFFYDGSIGEQCDGGNCMDVKQFREQLDYLKANHYKTLTMEEYRAWMFHEMELPARSVLITVDDGAMGTGIHNGNKLIPILEEYDMHATLFLITGWWSIENYRSPNLDVESHTYDMHKEGLCSNQTRGAQMLCSSYAEVIKDLEWSIMQTGSKKAFCFPFYAYNDTAIQALKEVGFQMAFVGGYRKSTRNDNPYTIPRYPVHSTTTMSQFINMIA